MHRKNQPEPSLWTPAAAPAFSPASSRALEASQSAGFLAWQADSCTYLPSKWKWNGTKGKIWALHQIWIHFIFTKEYAVVSAPTILRIRKEIIPMCLILNQSETDLHLFFSAKEPTRAKLGWIVPVQKGLPAQQGIKMDPFNFCKETSHELLPRNGYEYLFSAITCSVKLREHSNCCSCFFSWIWVSPWLNCSPSTAHGDNRKKAFPFGEKLA